MSELSSIFVGVPQSRYAALAILIAIVVVALTIIFGDSPVPMSQKFGFVLMVFLISLPGLALSLFQLTCIVTGAGANGKNWWCSVYSWVLSAIMIFYAVLLVIAAIMSLSSKNVEGFKAHTPKDKFNVDSENPSITGLLNIPEQSSEPSLPPQGMEMPQMLEQFTTPSMPVVPPAPANPTKPGKPSASEPLPSMPEQFTTPGMPGMPGMPKPMVENFTSSYAPW